MYEKNEVELDMNDLTVSKDFNDFCVDAFSHNTNTTALYNNVLIIDDVEVTVEGLLLAPIDHHVMCKANDELAYFVPVEIALLSIKKTNNTKSRFIMENLNPSGKIIFDGYIQAYAKIADKSWEESFKEQANFAYKISEPMTDMRTYAKFLVSKGFYKQYVKREKLLPIVDKYKNGIAVNLFTAIAMIDGNYYCHSNFDPLQITYVFTRRGSK